MCWDYMEDPLMCPKPDYTEVYCAMCDLQYRKEDMIVYRKEFFFCDEECYKEWLSKYQADYEDMEGK